jgi:hypothetical protein
MHGSFLGEYYAGGNSPIEPYTQPENPGSQFALQVRTTRPKAASLAAFFVSGPAHLGCALEGSGAQSGAPPGSQPD